MPFFPIEYSSLSVDALMKLLKKNYAIASDAKITFLKRGFNDTYLIESERNKFILRIYKHNWRSIESIETEIKFIQFLSESGISVSYPIQDLTKNFIQSINAFEGIRYAVLFSFAEGEQKRKLTNEQAYLLGIEIGKIHKLSENRSFGNTAHNYDIKNQFNISLQTLKPILTHHIEQYEYINRLQTEFVNKFNSVDKSQLATGICHGDLQAENFHVDSKDQFTFFDFDFFGSGYLIYDIGVFIWYDHKNKPKEIIASFLKGYQTQRTLTKDELELLPYFSTLRALFQMTLYCKISDGKQLPIWPAREVANFIKKVEKWFNEHKNLR